MLLRRIWDGKWNCHGKWMGLSENRVPQDFMVYLHFHSFPLYIVIWRVYGIRQSQTNPHDIELLFHPVFESPWQHLLALAPANEIYAVDRTSFSLSLERGSWFDIYVGKFTRSEASQPRGQHDVLKQCNVFFCKLASFIGIGHKVENPWFQDEFLTNYVCVLSMKHSRSLTQNHPWRIIQHYTTF